MQRVDVCRTTDCYPFNLYALVLVQPYGILIQVGKCLLRIISKFFQPVGQNLPDMTVYDLFDFKSGINLFTYCVDWNEPDCFYFLRNFLTVQDVCEKRIFIQTV